MASPKAPKDKFFEKVINPYHTGVLQHPQFIKMREGVMHIRDVEGPKRIGSVETRLEAMEQQVFKCQGMVERGLNANHMVITEFTNKHKIDANDIRKHLSRLYDRIDHLQAQIYDLQNENLRGHLTGLDMDTGHLIYDFGAKGLGLAVAKAAFPYLSEGARQWFEGVAPHHWCCNLTGLGLVLKHGVSPSSSSIGQV
ncbi:40S ribosomal protein S5-1 [Hordeum vulgare]|nr:40S ribosomal protein S5-1 [Hordeum vulgare]